MDASVGRMAAHRLAWIAVILLLVTAHSIDLLQPSRDTWQIGFAGLAAGCVAWFWLGWPALALQPLLLLATSMGLQQTMPSSAHILSVSLPPCLLLLSQRYLPISSGLPRLVAIQRFLLSSLGIAALASLSQALFSAHWHPEPALALWAANFAMLTAIGVPLLHYLSPTLLRSSTRSNRQQSRRDWPAPWMLITGAVILALLVYLPSPHALLLACTLLISSALFTGMRGACLSLAIVALWQLQLPWQAVPLNALELAYLALAGGACAFTGRILSDLRSAYRWRKSIQTELDLSRQVLNACPLGVVVLDAEPNNRPITYVNQAYSQMTGFTSSELLGKGDEILSGEDLMQGGMLLLREAMATGEACQVVVRQYHKDGHLFWDEITLAPLINGRQGRYYILLHQDVSARERLMHELMHSREAQLRQARVLSQTEAISDIGGWTWAVGSQDIYWTEGVYQILQVPNDFKPTLESSLSFYTAEDRGKVRHAMRKAVETGQPFDFEVRVCNAQKRLLWLRIKGLVQAEEGRAIRLYGAIQDITSWRETQQQLSEQDQRLRLFFDAPILGMALTSLQQEWLEVNQRLCDILGYTREQMLKLNWRQLTHPEDVDKDLRLFDEVEAGERDSYELEKRYRRADGEIVYARLLVQAVRNRSGQLQYCIGLIEDITQRREAEQRYRAIVEYAPEAIILWDAEQGIVEANGHAERMLRCKREALYGKSVEVLNERLAQANPGDSDIAERFRQALDGQQPVFEWRLLSAEGSPRTCEVRLIRMPGAQPLVRASFNDISERLRYQKEIERLAFHDTLTGLPNRVLLNDRLQQAMARARRQNQFGAVLLIDLDHFKHVNDSLGHTVGDQLLCSVAKRMRSRLRDEDTLGRSGGDEFVVLLDSLGDSREQAIDAATRIAAKVISSLHDSVPVGEVDLAISASLGISLFPQHDQEAEDVFRQADAAMYLAKGAGRNTLRFFSAEVQESLDERLTLQNELRHALKRKQLRLVFQPQVDMQTGKPTGAEALLRWQHPLLGNVPPDRFIGLAEEIGLMPELGLWVLDQACAEQARWQRLWPELALRMAVNLSAQSLRSEQLRDEVINAITRHSIAPSLLELEITEGSMLHDVEKGIGIMRSIKALGVQFAIDDFGTGYSSLTYLKRLPLDRLKIDRSFVRDLPKDANDIVLVDTMLAIAKQMHLEVVAEGVEEDVQWQFLRERGCHLGQGYLWSKPLEADDFKRWVSDKLGLNRTQKTG
ncbi:EAL domain-containing protein [Atopomonas sediminilitoris]|uniref:EAL domain-containing protein n=1 Tax=Atopomonas sediminilitoris TaxID=2919919 RepID=UPI001F4E2F27|nr:EAL domain-containing protein [Atopomonas sediminilitoris]MCJ8169385.1 EAL domain-containing protein [Atopomonas sediminilitoris]